MSQVTFGGSQISSLQKEDVRLISYCKLLSVVSTESENEDKEIIKNAWRAASLRDKNWKLWNV